MSKDNFKDEFERSRQEIKSHHHDENETTDAINEKDDQLQVSEEQQGFPPRNASRRHRKRDFGISKAKPTRKDTQTDQQEASSEKGQVDKKTGLISDVKKSDDNQLNHTQHNADDKRAQTADSIPNEPARDNAKGESVATGASAVGTGASAQTANNKKQHPKVANEEKNNQQEHHKGKKALGTGAGIGVSGEATASMVENDQRPKQNEKPASEKGKPQVNKGKKAAATGATGTTTGIGASKANAQQKQAHRPETESSETTVSNGSGDGFFKKFLPLLVAIILLGTVAIFGGMYLFNQDHQNGNQQEVTQKDDAKKNSDDNQQTESKDNHNKETDSDKAATSKDSDDKGKGDNSQSESDANNSDNSNASNPNGTSDANNSQNDVNNGNINNQQNAYQQGQSAGGQTHVVNGNQNLYRIAIQYYGNGSPENVEKIKRANGLQNNNISNGQQLIIP